jgi:hypothetical protein
MNIDILDDLAEDKCQGNGVVQPLSRGEKLEGENKRTG